MSRPSTAIFIFEHVSSAKPLDGLFLDHLSADSKCDEALRFSVPDLHCSLNHSGTGYSILTIFFSGSFEYAHPEKYDLFLRKITDLGRTTGAVFGFISTHDGQLEDKWLENEIISPILAGNHIEQTRIGSKIILLSNR